MSGMNCKLQRLVRRFYSQRLHGRSYMCKRWRVYCDGGYPVFRWFPRFHTIGYDKFWKMRGFWFNWIGRQVFVSFGRDVNGLYAKPNTELCDHPQQRKSKNK